METKFTEVRKKKTRSDGEVEEYASGVDSVCTDRCVAMHEWGRTENADLTSLRSI